MSDLQHSQSVSSKPPTKKWAYLFIETIRNNRLFVALCMYRAVLYPLFLEPDFFSIYHLKFENLILLPFAADGSVYFLFAFISTDSPLVRFLLLGLLYILGSLVLYFTIQILVPAKRRMIIPKGKRVMSWIFFIVFCLTLLATILTVIVPSICHDPGCWIPLNVQVCLIILLFVCTPLVAIALALLLMYSLKLLPLKKV